MPKTNIDYAKLVIYKIYCKDTEVDDLYVGRSTNYYMRQNSHKRACNKNDNQYLYTVINTKGGWSNWVIEKIEDYPCLNSIEAGNREQYWINKLQASLNVQIKFDNTPDTDYKKEWYFKNREKVRAKHEAYRTQKKKEKEDYLASFNLDFDDETNNPEWFINNMNLRQVQVK
tara:strand:+ start:911 stop:1426 length:516 start_codon:yes stop_codon:yes gene_type:complete